MTKQFKIFLVAVAVVIALYIIGQAVAYIYPAEGLFDTRCWNPETRVTDRTDNLNGLPPDYSLLDCIRRGVAYIVYAD